MHPISIDAEKLDEILNQADIDLTTKIFNQFPDQGIEDCLNLIIDSLQIYEAKESLVDDLDRSYLSSLHESIRQLSQVYKVFHNTKECKELFLRLEDFDYEGNKWGAEQGKRENIDYSSAPRQFQDLIGDPLLVPLLEEQKRNKQIRKLSIEVDEYRKDRKKENRLINLELCHKVISPKMENYLWIVKDGEVACCKLRKENFYAEFEFAYGFDRVLSARTNLNLVRQNKDVLVYHDLSLPLDSSELFQWNLRDKEPAVAAAQIVNDDWATITLGGRNNILFEIFTLLQLEKVRQEKGGQYVLLGDFFDNLHLRGVLTGSSKALENYLRQIERGKKKKDEQDFFVNKSNFFEVRKLPECQILGSRAGCCEDSQYVIQFRSDLRLAIHEARIV